MCNVIWSTRECREMHHKLKLLSTECCRVIRATSVNAIPANSRVFITCSKYVTMWNLLCLCLQLSPCYLVFSLTSGSFCNFVPKPL